VQLLSRLWTGDGYSGKSFYSSVKYETSLMLDRIVAMVVGLLGVLLFFFLPESFWDRTPRPRSRKSSKNHSRVSVILGSSRNHSQTRLKGSPQQVDGVEDEPKRKPSTKKPSPPTQPSATHQPPRNLHVGFAGKYNEKIDGFPLHSPGIDVPAAPAGTPLGLEFGRF